MCKASYVIIVLSIVLIALVINMISKEKYIAPAEGYTESVLKAQFLASQQERYGIPKIPKVSIKTTPSPSAPKFQKISSKPKEAFDPYFKGGVNPTGSISNFNSVPDLDRAARFGTLAVTNSTMGWQQIEIFYNYPCYTK